MDNTALRFTTFSPQWQKHNVASVDILRYRIPVQKNNCVKKDVDIRPRFVQVRKGGPLWQSH